jgi:hypothetical protein
VLFNVNLVNTSTSILNKNEKDFAESYYTLIRMCAEELRLLRQARKSQSEKSKKTLMDLHSKLNSARVALAEQTNIRYRQAYPDLAFLS